MVCGHVRFKSVALVNEVERTGPVTELSIYETKGACGGSGEESMVAAQKGKTSQDRKGKSNGKRNSLRADALEHLYGEAHVLTLRASFESEQLPALSSSVQVDEGGHLDHSERSGDVGSS